MRLRSLGSVHVLALLAALPACAPTAAAAADVPEGEDRRARDPFARRPNAPDPVVACEVHTPWDAPRPRSCPDAPIPDRVRRALDRRQR